MINKRGAELAISTLVIIVIAVVVLIVIIVGFTTGWSQLWMNISAFFGGSNLDSIVQACNTACLTKSTNAWCNEQRTITGDSSITTKQTCEQLKGNAGLSVKPSCDTIQCPS